VAGIQPIVVILQKGRFGASGCGKLGDNKDLMILVTWFVAREEYAEREGGGGGHDTCCRPLYSNKCFPVC
jgi:hypothetical protein